jgi:hypothetical protein
MSEDEKHADKATNIQNYWQPVWDWINTTGFWLLIGFAVLCAIGVALLAFKVDNWNDRANVLTVGVLSVLTFVLLAINTVTSREMIETVRGQESEMTLQRQAMRDSVHRMEQHEARMIEQAEIMKGQLEVMKKGQQSLYLSERAYLTVKDLEWMNAPLSANITPQLKCSIVNGGRTPAFKVFCGHGTAATTQDINEIADQLLAGGMGFAAEYMVSNERAPVMLPSPTVPTADFVAKWETGAAKYYWLVRLTYEDFNGARHNVNFWFEYKNVLEGRWALVRLGDYKMTVEPGALKFIPGEANLTYSGDAPGDEKKDNPN